MEVVKTAWFETDGYQFPKVWEIAKLAGVPEDAEWCWTSTGIKFEWEEEYE